MAYSVFTYTPHREYLEAQDLSESEAIETVARIAKELKDKHPTLRTQETALSCEFTNTRCGVIAFEYLAKD